MAPVWLFAFLHKAWKPLLIGSIAVVLIGGAYFKGRRDYAVKAEREVAKEVQRRYQEAEKIRQKTDKRRRDLRRSFEQEPYNDERDSCILSNDPFNTDC